MVERTEHIAAMRALTGAAEKRSDQRLTEAEAASWGEHNARVDALKEEIKRAETMNKLEKEDSDLSTHPEPDKKGDDEFGFRSFDEYLTCVRDAGAPGATPDPRLVESRVATGQNTSNPEEGGYLSGTQHVKALLKRSYEKSALAQRCSKITIGSGADGLSMNAVNESSRVDGSQWGGVVAYRRADAETVTASKMKFRQIKLDLEDMMCLMYATDRSLTDATQLASIMGEAGTNVLSWKLDNEILKGTGAGECLGVLNSDATIAIPKETAQLANTIVYENVRKMRNRMWAPSFSRSAWFINQDCNDELQTMAFVVGTGGVPVYLPANGVAGNSYDTLYGRPVIPIEQANTVGTVGDISLIDLSQYLLIDKGGVENDVSMHVRFLYAEKVFRYIIRVNGQPLWNTALTPANGTNTLSPQITLASRD
ncbi:MAG: phage major capsid protein [Bacteroidetes bacterium]|nr:phage major capsid protein [Bacteroidota bacterium]